MSEKVTHPSSIRSEWPTFSIRHTYNPDDIATDVSFEPNEVVFYDAKTRKDGRWMSAKYDSYVSVTDVR